MRLAMMSFRVLTANERTLVSTACALRDVRVW
jgi:hypothetical protein